MVATVVVTLSDATFDDPPPLEAVTTTVPDTEPAVAVTVIAVPVATPAAVSVVVATPFALVVPVVADRVPPVAPNVTVAPATAAPLEFTTVELIVAEVEPSVGMVAEPLLTVTFAGVVLPVPVLVPVQLEALELLLLVPEPPLRAPQPLSPPQPAKASVTTNRAISAANLRIFLS
jgi:hypothetical protein